MKVSVRLVEIFKFLIALSFMGYPVFHKSDEFKEKYYQQYIQKVKLSFFDKK